MKDLFFIILLNSIFILSCDNGSSSSNFDNCKNNPCKDSPVEHKTVCENKDDGFICICEDGYTLNNDTGLCIVEEVNPCKDNPCLDSPIPNKTVCEVVANDFKCVCESGYIESDNTCKKLEENSFHKTWTDNSYTENSGISLTTDSNKNIIVVGYQSSKMEWDENLQKDIPSTNDVTLRKYSSKGVLIWEKVWHEDAYKFPVGVVVDKNNNIFIAGETGGDEFRAFLMKVDANGNEKWNREWSCANGLLVWDLAIDNDDALYITGRVYSNFSNTSKVGGISDSFLIKAIDNGGSAKEKWIKQWGTEKMDEGKAITIRDNNIFVLTENNGDSDIENGDIKWDFNITKFDKSGTILSDTNWMKGQVDTYVVDFVIDTNNNYYIIGDAPNNFDGHTNSGENDIFIVKLDTTLNKVWSKLIGTTYYDTTNSITIDSSNNIFIAGHSYGSFGSFTNPGEGVETDSILIKFKNDSEIDWYKMYSSTNRLAGESISKIIIKNDNLIFTGVENADYIGDTQNIKSSGFLRKVLKSDF